MSNFRDYLTIFIIKNLNIVIIVLSTKNSMPIKIPTSRSGLLKTVFAPSTHKWMLGANTSKEGCTGGISERKYRAMSRHCLLMDTPTARYEQGRTQRVRPPMPLTKEHSVLRGDLISNFARGHTLRLSDAYLYDHRLQWSYKSGGIFVLFYGSCF